MRVELPVAVGEEGRGLGVLGLIQDVGQTWAVAADARGSTLRAARIALDAAEDGLQGGGGARRQAG